MVTLGNSYHWNTLIDSRRWSYRVLSYCLNFTIINKSSKNLSRL